MRTKRHATRDYAKLSPLGLRALPHSLAGCHDWNGLVDVLTDLGFIAAKCAAGMTRNVLQDYRTALAAIPDIAEEQREARRRAQRLREYVGQLVACANAASVARDRSGERSGANQTPFPSAVPKSCVPEGRQPGQETAARMPPRLQLLRAFADFLAEQAPGLARWACQPVFCWQQATHSASSGPVREQALKRLACGCRHPVFLAAPGFLASPVRRKALVYAHSTRNAGFRCVALDCIGKVAVTGGDDRLLRIWDVETRELVAALPGQPGRIFCIAVTPDGRVCISGDYEGHLQTWDVAGRRSIRAFDAHDGALFAADLSADGHIAITGGEDRVVRAWDLQNARLIQEFREGDLGQVRCVACTPDGRIAFSGHAVDPDNFNTVQSLLNVWDIESGKRVRRLWQFSNVRRLAVTPDGSTVISGDSEGTMRFWQRGQPKPSQEIDAHRGAIQGLAVTHDGKLLVSGGADNLLRLWDAGTGTCLRTVRAHKSGPAAIALSADAATAVSVGDAMDDDFKVWDLVAGEAPESGASHAKSVNWVEFLPRQQLVVSSDAECLMVTPTAGHGKARCYSVNDPVVSSWCSTPDQHVFGTVQRDGRIRVWEPESRDPPTTYTTDVEVRSAIFSTGTSCMLLSRWDGSVENWDVHDKGPGQVLFVHRQGDTWLVPFSDGRFAMSGGTDGTRRIWDLEAGECRLTVRLRDGEEGRHVSRDGRLALFYHDHGLQGFDLVGRRWCIDFRPAGEERINGIAVVPDGRHVLVWLRSQGGQRLQIVDLQTGEAVASLGDGRDRIAGAQVLPGSDLVVTVDEDGTLCAWNIRAQKRIAAYYEPTGISTISSVHAQGRVALGTRSGTVRLLRLQNVALAAPIVTAVLRWSRGPTKGPGRWDDCPSAVCPWCREWFHLGPEKNEVMEALSAGPGVSEYDVPCLALPTSAWDNPRLNSSCPLCRNPIRFNPFVVDNRHEFHPSAVRRGIRQICAAPGSTTALARDDSERCLICGQYVLQSAVVLSDGRRVCRGCIRETIGSVHGKWIREERQSARCALCAREKWQAALVLDERLVCALCCECLLEEVSHTEDVGTWTLEDAVGALAPGSSVYARLATLWHFDEMAQLLGNKEDPRLAVFLRAVTTNLGFDSPHASSSLVRRLALGACAKIGATVVPQLRRAYRARAWRLRANILLACGAIDPEEPTIRELLCGAVNDAEAQVRATIAIAIAHHETNWTRGLVERLLDDSDESVRNVACRVADAWDVQGGRMMAEDGEFRMFVEELLAQNDPGARRLIPRSLKRRRAIWARKLAERLARDPDPEVRAEVEKLYQHWRGENGA